MKKAQQKIPSPLLHRLIDEQADVVHDTNVSLFIDVDALKHDIKQHLESILNTRLALLSPQKTSNKINYSVLTYGIADFTQPHYNVTAQQHVLCRHIERAITHFEPRLQKIVITLSDNMNNASRQLQLRIAGELNLKPNSKAAIFETSLDIVNHSFDIHEDLT